MTFAALAIHWPAATGATTREFMARMGHASAEAASRYRRATRKRDAAIALDTTADQDEFESGRGEANSRSQLGKGRTLGGVTRVDPRFRSSILILLRPNVTACARVLPTVVARLWHEERLAALAHEGSLCRSAQGASHCDVRDTVDGSQLPEPASNRPWATSLVSTGCRCHLSWSDKCPDGLTGRRETTGELVRGSCHRAGCFWEGPVGSSGRRARHTCRHQLALTRARGASCNSSSGILGRPPSQPATQFVCRDEHTSSHADSRYRA
jgi:hypothetical protein